MSAGPVDEWAASDLAALERAGLRRHLEPLDSPQGAVVTLGGRQYLNFSSNDYLGLAAEPALARAAAAALERHGTGAGASRLVVGDTAAHASLERALARFEGAEAALVFNSGFAANTGVLPALLGPGDVVFSDALNHASLVDGCRLSRAQTVIYPHCDAAALGELLRAHPGRRRLVVTDAVFSMDGDRAPVRALRALCDQHGAGLMVDEAHATGVLGATGAGLCELEGVRPDVLMGTLSKALGSFGAYVAGSAALREVLLNRARAFVFSTALPAALCAASEAALEHLRRTPALRERLGRNLQAFAAGLRGLGLAAEPSSAIFPVVLGAPARAVEAAQALRDARVLVKPIRPPTVPEGTSRLRFALSAAHTPQHLERALEALAGVLRPARRPLARSPSPTEDLLSLSREARDDGASTSSARTETAEPVQPEQSRGPLPHQPQRRGQPSSPASHAGERVRVGGLRRQPPPGSGTRDS